MNSALFSSRATTEAVEVEGEARREASRYHVKSERRRRLFTALLVMRGRPALSFQWISLERADASAGITDETRC
jgi:hypothetical protein